MAANTTADRFRDGDADQRPKKHVFFSYCREDEEAVQRLRRRLEKAGFSVWMDTESLVGSQRWARAIADGLCDSYVVLCCVTRKWQELNAFVHDEAKLALEVEKRLAGGHEIIVPVMLERCGLPAQLAERQWVDYTQEDDASFQKLVEAIRLVLARTQETRSPVTPRLREYGGKFLEYAVYAKGTRFIRWCELLATILLGLLTLEIGILQEWAPHEQHPNGFLGWGSRESITAIGFSLLAALAAMACNREFFRRAREHSAPLAEYTGRFYGLAVTLLAIAFVASFLLLLATTHEIPGMGDRLPRSGRYQVFKALAVTYAELFFLLWPSWFLALWVARGGTYRKPAVFAPRASSVMIIMVIAIVGMGGWQYYTVKNPREVGYGDLWRTTHVAIQAILMAALAFSAWWLRSTAEDLEEKAQALQDARGGGLEQ